MQAWSTFPGILKIRNRHMKLQFEEDGETKMKRKEKWFRYIDEGSIHL
jgi:hypothetical protein